MAEKPKVYVETTVVSDATALPARDVVQLGRQVVTREWWATAADRFDLYSSKVVDREIRMGDPEAARRRIDAMRGLPELEVGQLERPRMTLEKRYDDGLEEIWRIKREICAGYANVEDYFRSVLDDQDLARRQGVRFVRLPIARREKDMV